LNEENEEGLGDWGIGGLGDWGIGGLGDWGIGGLGDWDSQIKNQQLEIINRQSNR
jgi:hypothetical protein